MVNSMLGMSTKYGIVIKITYIYVCVCVCIRLYAYILDMCKVVARTCPW